MQEAHTSSGRRRCRRGKVCVFISLLIYPFSKHFECDLKYFQAESMSITSVLYLKDEVSLATAGAVDRCVTMLQILTSVTHLSYSPS